MTTDSISRARSVLLATAIGFVATLSMPAVAGDAAAGQTKATTCIACHGQDFKTPIDPSYAILAGQLEDYLVVALKAYRSGARKNAVMAGMAAPLSNDDIYDLAAYLSSLPGPLGYKK